MEEGQEKKEIGVNSLPKMKRFDIAILTERRLEDPEITDDLIENVLEEDRIVQKALESRGLSVIRVDWAHQDFNWDTVKSAIFRSTWDYSDRYEEFKKWCKSLKNEVTLINTYEQINWNVDKHYLKELESKGINIPESVFIEPGQKITLTEIHRAYGWSHSVLKPAISAGARHTYQLNEDHLDDYEATFQELIKVESMMLQPFLKSIPSTGELSLMMMNGRYTHAVIKKAKAGDFRVQDDFGGTVSTHEPTKQEILFAEKVIQACDEIPLYARVDIVWDNEDELALSELELIEPELWFRFNPQAAEVLVEGIVNRYFTDK